MIKWVQTALASESIRRLRNDLILIFNFMPRAIVQLALDTQAPELALVDSIYLLSAEPFVLIINCHQLIANPPLSRSETRIPEKVESDVRRFDLDLFTWRLRLNWLYQRHINKQLISHETCRYRSTRIASKFIMIHKSLPATQAYVIYDRPQSALLHLFPIFYPDTAGFRMHP